MQDKETEINESLVDHLALTVEHMSSAIDDMAAYIVECTNVIELLLADSRISKKTRIAVEAVINRMEVLTNPQTILDIHHGVLADRPVIAAIKAAKQNYSNATESGLH